MRQELKVHLLIIFFSHSATQLGGGFSHPLEYLVYDRRGHELKVYRPLVGVPEGSFRAEQQPADSKVETVTGYPEKGGAAKLRADRQKTYGNLTPDKSSQYDEAHKVRETG